MNTKLKGSWGENEAAVYLRKHGYSIRGANYRTRFGEIDIIAEDRNYIVFAEVKLRKNAKFAAASDYVDQAKQRRLRATASFWLSQNETDKQPRFDVIEIYYQESEYGIQLKDINHLINGFE